jgi:hypothetical protein
VFGLLSLPEQRLVAGYARTRLTAVVSAALDRAILAIVRVDSATTRCVAIRALD